MGIEGILCGNSPKNQILKVNNQCYVKEKTALFPNNKTIQPYILVSLAQCPNVYINCSLLSGKHLKSEKHQSFLQLEWGTKKNLQCKIC